MLKNGTKSYLTVPETKSQDLKPSPYHIQGVFGYNIKQRRLDQGLTQEQLAEKAGISADTVKRYESMRSEGVRLDMAYYIAVALGVPLQALLPPQDCSFEQFLCTAEAMIRTAREIYKTK